MANRRAIVGATAALVGGLAWLPLTSAALHVVVPIATPPTVTRSSTFPGINLDLAAPALFYWRNYREHPLFKPWLVPCAVVSGLGALLPAGFALCLPMPSRRLRPGRPGDPVPEPERAASDTHGSARMMTEAEALRLFPAGAGGVVIGQLGKGSNAPLLVDQCNTDAPHGIVIGGSGSGKTSGVTIPTLDPLVGWPGSVVVHDPKCKVAEQTAGMRIAAGQRVVILGIGKQGMNVLDWIDPADPEATAHVRSTVCMIGKEKPENPASDPMWTSSSAAVLFTILAHMIWDPTLRREEKTLGRFARMVAVSQPEMRSFLRDIHASSGCEEARIKAGTLMNAPDRTFGSFYQGAQSDVEWLLNPAYAALVSSGDLRSDELANGRTTVFVQIPMDTLKDTPEVARTVFNALLRGVYRFNGQTGRRVLFLLDEMHLLGRMTVLEIARDTGRESGITLVPMWQSMGQITKTWGESGKRDWFGSAAWSVFARVDYDTAKELSEWAGTYTGLARTENKSRGTSGGMSGGSANRGQSEGLHELPIPVFRPDWLMGLPADEGIVLRPGSPGPLHRNSASWFNRPEMAVRVGA